MPPSRLSALVGAGALFASVAVSGCGTDEPARDTSADVAQVSVSACGRGWDHAGPGDLDLRLHNTDSRPGEAQVVDPRSGAIFADVEPIGPGTTVAVHLRLTGGDYAVRCLMEDEGVITGRPVTVRGRADDATRGVAPVDQSALVRPTQAYERYVAARLPGLQRQVDRLSSALTAGSVPRARAAWLRAHATYETLGAAYDAFGDLAGAINGLPDGLARGVHDSGWTGFHQIEHGLWHGERPQALAASAVRLGRDVDALRRQFADAQIDPLVLTIRAHEITENALQLSLTGRDDFGSHSALGTVAANLVGTREVLDLLAPTMRSRGLDVDGIDAALTRARRLVASLPGRRAVSALPTPDRERLDAALSDLSERLAPVAASLEPRRTS